MKLGFKHILARFALTLCAGMATAATAADAPANAAAKPDAGKGQTIATQVCAACHGADGNSTITANPKLAGQMPEYIVKQLTNFKAAAGKKAERENPVMAGMVAALSPDDMKNLAAYFGGQKAKDGAARNKDLVTLGQKIWRGGISEKGVAACASCHGANGAGVPSQYPRLAGQHAEYTEAQMKAWRSEQRANDPAKMMRTTAAKLSDKEIQAVSDYIAGLH
jgi:cytochrome c553